MKSFGNSYDDSHMYNNKGINVGAGMAGLNRARSDGFRALQK